MQTPSPPCHPERAKRAEGSIHRVGVADTFIFHFQFSILYFLFSAAGATCHPERAERAEGSVHRVDEVDTFIFLFLLSVSCFSFSAAGATCHPEQAKRAEGSIHRVGECRHLNQPRRGDRHLAPGDRREPGVWDERETDPRRRACGLAESG